MTDIRSIQYKDLTDAEKAERDRLAADKSRLDAACDGNRVLSSEQQNERERLAKLIELYKHRDAVSVEPLFVAARKLFNENPAVLGLRLVGLTEGRWKWASPGVGKDELDALKAAEERAAVAVSAAKTAVSEADAVAKVAGRAKAAAQDAAKAAAQAQKSSKDAAAELARKKIANPKDPDIAKFEAAAKAAEAKAELAEKASEKATNEANAAEATAGTASDGAQKAAAEAEAVEREFLSAEEVVNKAKAKADRERAAAEPQASEKAALIIGLLMADKAVAPKVVLSPDPELRTAPDASDDSKKDSESFVVAFWRAVAEAKGREELAALVLPILGSEGDPDGDKGRNPSVRSGQFAGAVRTLHADGVTSKEPMLRRKVNEALDRILRVGKAHDDLDAGIDLPDLDKTADNEIVAENVLLMGPMIVSAMFDELKAFNVVDKLVELFQAGQLPIGSGDAGHELYIYWKEAPNRMSEGERRNFYAMTMGIPGGDAMAKVNRDFNDLWLRFVSSVSSYIRQNEADRLLRAHLPYAVSQQQVRKAARDLAANLSLHGYGMAFYAALELQKQVKFMIRLLSYPDIRNAYGARDMWQVIDQVATLELGGARTSSRYRTLANCGAIITAWLANNVQRIMLATGSIIDVHAVRHPSPPPSGHKPTRFPSDYDLVNACELWLADTATSDDTIEQLAQPRETPMMTSKPIPIPSIAREMLGDLPSLGMSYGTRPNGAAARH